MKNLTIASDSKLQSQDVNEILSYVKWAGTALLPKTVIGDNDLLGTHAFWWTLYNLQKYDLSKIVELDLHSEHHQSQPVYGACYVYADDAGDAIYRVRCGVPGPFPYVTRQATLDSPIITLLDQEEAIVWVMAHEIGHYLARTEQVDFQNIEALVHKFSNDWLKDWREYLQEVSRVEASEDGQGLEAV